MASSTSSYFGIIQNHINIQVWYYQQCLQGQRPFWLLSIMNITSAQWKICTILLLFWRKLKITALKCYAMVWREKESTVSLHRFSKIISTERRGILKLAGQQRQLLYKVTLDAQILCHQLFMTPKMGTISVLFHLIWSGLSQRNMSSMWIWEEMRI